MELPDRKDPNNNSSLVKKIIGTPLKYTGKALFGILKYMNVDITLAQSRRNDDVYMAEIVKDNSNFLKYQYEDNRGAYQVNFNKRSGVLSITPNVAPIEALESLEQGVPGIIYREFPDQDRTNDFRSWHFNNKMMQLPVNELYHNGIPSQHPRALDTRSLP